MLRSLVRVSTISWMAVVAFACGEVTCRAATVDQSAAEQLEVLGFDLSADGFARAVARKQRRLIDLFLRAKADPNVGVSAGKTPLLHAISAGESSLVSLLLTA